MKKKKIIIMTLFIISIMSVLATSLFVAFANLSMESNNKGRNSNQIENTPDPKTGIVPPKLITDYKNGTDELLSEKRKYYDDNNIEFDILLVFNTYTENIYSDALNCVGHRLFVLPAEGSDYKIINLKGNFCPISYYEEDNAFYDICGNADSTAPWFDISFEIASDKKGNESVTLQFEYITDENGDKRLELVSCSAQKTKVFIENYDMISKANSTI
ncbi:MAG: hypothetical protein IKH41_03420 [Clostridia bacterium]|nr:hypothetical protein [Clostridia bacterium]